MIRLFAALPIPHDIAEGLARRQQGLPGARWSPAETLHITLRFFGEVEEGVAAELDAELGRVSVDSFDLTLQGVGTRGGLDGPKSAWASVAESEPLRRLAAKCETSAKRCGLPPEKRVYRPHVTLAYLKRAVEPRVAAWLQGHNLLHSPPWRVRSFGLYSSWLSQEGARYDLERDYPLT